MEGCAGKLKNLLIITPHFPPVNSADMHRVRQSLPYYREFGWNPVIITVDPKHIESYNIDPLLSLTIPPDIRVYKVGALPVKTTRKFGLGSLSMRAYFQVQKKGNELLRKEHFDLVFFSTTAFHVMAIGPGWKKKYGVPFILDIQDPWRNDFYLSKPASERPPKFFISYQIDKKMESSTVPKADGIMSVSSAYCDTFKERYNLPQAKCKVIPFGASNYDFEIMRDHVQQSSVKLKEDKINLVYIGRGGHDMKTSLQIIFNAFRKGLQEEPALFSQAHFSFIGTSYALPGQGQKTIEPLAEEMGIKDYVTEMTDRIPYFETLYLLRKADILLVPGSNDNTYTASKIYPYILAERPLLALFHENSSVINVLKDVGLDTYVTFGSQTDTTEKSDAFHAKMKRMLAGGMAVSLNHAAFEPYTARARAKEQTDFFNEVIQDKKLDV
ncbi:MAG: hypothetical protein C5B59_15060 [Bacteroidetes bacterium]|nr:MAG: hypothetical protein C5B59_15060 [Bacteroidota bacterium]